jgi:outer membrane receptor protein involved in Fe transport
MKSILLASTIIAVTPLSVAQAQTGGQPTGSPTGQAPSGAITEEPAVRENPEAQADVSVKASEEIVVTGSRIVRPDLTNSVPTVVVGQDAFENRGIENIADIATQLPQFSPAYGTSRTQSTFSGSASSGLNTINLRNLGGGRTLTLLNGRRMAAGTTTTTTVDFNTIPTANISRMEVITGGASAIYGADAVAGVVNIITDKSLRGFQAGASYGLSKEDDNRNPNLFARFGMGLGDGGYVQLTGQYDYQGFVGCADRYLCAEDFAWTPTLTDSNTQLRGPGTSNATSAYSAVGVGGTYFLTAGNGLPAVSATQINGNYTDANGALIPFFTPRDGYNRNATRTLAIPTKRYLFAGDAEYPITDAMKVFLEVNYGRSKTKGEFEAHPFQSSQAGSLFGGGPGVPGLQASIPVTNPFVPVALRNAAVARGQTVIQWQQRLAGIGDRGATNEREMMRFAGGLKGDFQAFGGRGWNWEVSYVNGRTKLESITDGLVSTGNLYHGLRVEAVPGSPGQFQCADATARANGCVPINPFDGYNEAERAALNVTAGQTGTSKLNDLLAFVSGDLFALPGGDLGVAVGAEYRTFEGNLDYDDVINNALVTGNQIGDVDAVKTKTAEVFVEGIAPILRDVRLAHSLTLEGAFRFSKPEGGKSYNTWRYGGSWEPEDKFMVRVMRGRAVRTPVPGELSGVGQTFGTVNDPCAAAQRGAQGGARDAACDAAGVPDNYTPPLNVTQSVGGFVGGNPNLAPEIATTLTYGFAYQPPMAPGLSLTLDRFEIELEDVITTVGRQQVANQCYDAGLFCASVTRGTNPNVPGANYVLTGVNDQLTNVATLDIRGFDFSARYDTRLFGGRLSLNALGTRYDRAKRIVLPGTPATDLRGFAGGSTSDQGYVKFTGTGNVNWRATNGINFNYNLRYIGKSKTSPFAPSFYPSIPAHTYHNARIGAELMNFEVWAGVDNIFNKAPPFFPTSTAGTQALDTVPALYDVFGRSFYFGVKRTF